jgi:sulfite reductase beta subunit-like hemoprotein
MSESTTLITEDPLETITESSTTVPNNEKKLTINERVKEGSDYLRGMLVEELHNEADSFSAETAILTRFHGIFQQDDRDRRPKGQGAQKFHQLMVRGRIPAGKLIAEQYVAWDDLADRYGNRSLRITTRQGLQLHGIMKQDVREVIRGINAALCSTIATSGDAVRNVTQPVNPLGLPELDQLDEICRMLTRHCMVKSPAYAEIFLDGEKLDNETIYCTESTVDPTEPLFGRTYLPKKINLGVTLAGHNGIDVYSNDVAFAATLDHTGQITGYFVFAGGGLGLNHNNPSTFARAADCLGWVPAHALIPVTEALIGIQRDYGNRGDRKYGRLKYVVAAKGPQWLQHEVQQRTNLLFSQINLPAWDTPNYLGWHRRRDGTWALGFYILSGRIADQPGCALKSALREVIEQYALKVQLTADQDLILIGIKPSDREAIEARLAELGVNPESPAPVYDKALACPALPTCGLAVAEAERVMPRILSEIHEILEKLELNHYAPTIRVSGCPNACSRTYTAELGLAGRTANAYAVYVGGDYEGTRMGKLLYDNVTLDDLPNLVRRLFSLWKVAKQYKEQRFGDFTDSYQVDALRTLLTYFQ